MINADFVKLINNPEVQESLSTKIGRRAFVQLTGFVGFIAIYLNHKFPLEPADFQIGLIETLDSLQEFIAVLGFRGSAKSTIVEAYALYSLVTEKSPFTVLIRDTGNNARASLANIKSEIEENSLLLADYNIPLQKRKRSITEKWSESQINIGKSTIMARSRGQKVRGLKFGDKRITMVILDDVENVESTKTIENRKKTREWFFTEVVPATSQGILAVDVKVIVIGNLVHKDCLIAHLENKDIVTVHKFAIYNDDGTISWDSLYPNEEAVEAQKKKVMLAGKGLGNIIWNREYLLKLIDEDDQPVKESDIQYYPKSWLQRKIVQSGTGMDLAISKKETADYTAMVSGYVVLNDFGEKRLLILPNVINERLGFAEMIETAKTHNKRMVQYCEWFVEGVMYQQSAIEMLKKNGIHANSIHPTSDKRARLMAVSSYIQTGVVLFPETGCEDLIMQLLGFGVEAHDDMVDALVYLIDGLLNQSDEPVFG